ncbi:hypothetical protein D3C73_1474790 [compost metagenome]
MVRLQPSPANQEVIPVREVLESTSVHPPLATTLEPIPQDEFQLNLDDLSINTSWDLGAMENPSVAGEPRLSEVEMEWDIEPVCHTLDASFLDEFKVAGPSLEPEPLRLKRVETE